MSTALYNDDAIGAILEVSCHMETCVFPTISMRLVPVREVSFLIENNCVIFDIYAEYGVPSRGKASFHPSARKYYSSGFSLFRSTSS
jgi:hypothetical protein